jgi:hypothetical protein
VTLSSPRWKDDDLTPFEALQRTIGYSLVSHSLMNGRTPGEAVSRMRPDIRKALSELRSDDVEDIRLPGG